MSQPAGGWKAWYYDGPAREEVRVYPESAGLAIRPLSGPALFWPYAEVQRVTETFSGAPLRFERRGRTAETLIVTDHSLLAGIRAAAPASPIESPAGTRRRTLGWLTALVIGGIVAIYALFSFVLPWAGAAMAMLIPVSWEDASGSRSPSGLLQPRNAAPTRSFKARSNTSSCGFGKALRIRRISTDLGYAPCLSNIGARSSRAPLRDAVLLDPSPLG